VSRRRFLIVAAAIALTACRAGQNGEQGGPAEARLMDATVTGNLARVEELLTGGANPNKLALADGHLQAPWKIALRRARPNRPESAAIVRAMLKAGANPAVAFGEEPSRSGGYSVQPVTPILEAVATSSPDVARALMQAGLEPRLGGVALANAVENGEIDIVHVLVDAGVDVNTRAGAITPLVAAIERRNVALMTYLEEHGAREKP